MTTRECSICGVIFPLSRDYFSYGRTCVDNISHVCKLCTNKQKAEWKRKNKKPPKIKTKPIDARNKLVLKSARLLRQGILKRSSRLNINCDKKTITISYLYDYIVGCPWWA